MEDNHALTIEEANSMEEVYRDYVEEWLEDIYNLSPKDNCLVSEVVGAKSLWHKVNPKIMGGFNKRFNEFNKMLSDYGSFREILYQSGKCPSYKNKAMELIRRN